MKEVTSKVPWPDLFSLPPSSLPFKALPSHGMRQYLDCAPGGGTPGCPETILYALAHAARRASSKVLLNPAD